MISWIKSAELNKTSIKELKAYFRRYPKSHKKVVAVCDGCGVKRTVSHSRYFDRCQICACRTETCRSQARASHMGNKPSEKTRLKMRDASKGKKKSPEHCANIRKAGKGKTISLEARRKHSATAQGIPYDEWEGFAKEQLYCPRFNEACKESNREKYGRECFICGKSEKANGQKLSVHHVDMDKAQGCESNWKLVPLCRSCHSSAHNDELIARLGYMVKDSKTRGKQDE